MLKKALLFALLAGCSSPEEVPPPGAPASPVDRELQKVRDTLYGARTLRVRLRGEWPWAVASMPRSVSGTLLLGPGDRAKISLAISYAGGRVVTHEAVSDGTRLWRSPGVEAANFSSRPSGLRPELLNALAWHGIGWSFPQGPRPTTIGMGYVICDLLPQERDLSPSTVEREDAKSKVITHQSPGVDYRVRLSFDPGTRHLRKRELIGDQGKVWYVETYLETELNAPIPDEEFKLPEK
jgi:hypothetical protein